MLGDYSEDAEFRERFQAWVNQIWQEKDALLQQMQTSWRNIEMKNSGIE